MHSSAPDVHTSQAAVRFDAAIEVARSAGAIALEYFARAATLVVEHKGAQDLVSEADRETETHIRSEILARFPGDAFMGEEHGYSGGDADSGTWVVDPIDGTQPFLLGLPTWCVSIAYVVGDRTEIGVIFNPASDELYAAATGRGAFLNGEPISVREANSLSDGLTGVGCSPKTKPEDLAEIMLRLLKQGGMYQRTGSGAINLAYVAAGKHIGYVETRIHAWDCLAAVCLIEQAGGLVSPFLANFGAQGAGPLVAGAPGVYDALLGLMPEDVISGA
jgi:myo-inositol-1(or 4)-monophosphatase